MSAQGSREEVQGRHLVAMSITALGIVFGHIGTSPIYALRESFHAANGIDPTQANVLGVLSLNLWSRGISRRPFDPGGLRGERAYVRYDADELLPLERELSSYMRRAEWRNGGSGSSAACLEILFSRPPTSGFPRTASWNWGCRCSCSY